MNTQHDSAPPELHEALKRTHYDTGGTVEPQTPSWYNEPVPIATTESAGSDTRQSLQTPTAAPSTPGVGGGGGGIGYNTVGKFTDFQPPPKIDSFQNAYSPTLPQATLSQQQVAQQRAAALQPFIDAIAQLKIAQQTPQQQPTRSR